MSVSQLADLPDILTLAKQGDPKAIAALLNQALNPNGIFAKVGSHSDCLGILLESLPVPDQDEMVAMIRQILFELKPESIQFVKVAGYQPGQNLPAWYEEIELEKVLTIAESGYRAASVESWLNQGLEPTGGYNRISLSADSNATQAVNERRFLRFCMNERETALLSLSQIQQVLKVPVVEILPVPHMPDCVLGIYNWRGETLWLVDLAQQLGFPSALTDLRTLETVSTITIQVDQRFLGMVVPQTIDIETHNLQQLQPPTAGLFPAKLLSCMQGYFVTSGSPVLNAKALIQDPLLQVHCPH